MIFPLIQDFADTLAALPREHRRHRILELLNEAIRSDVHFIERHPTTLFQSLWNSCWWYDCDELARYYESTDVPLPIDRAAGRLADLMQSFRDLKTQGGISLPWLRSLRPPATRLGSSMQAVLRAHDRRVYSVCFSPDGQRVARAAESVCVWDVHSGAILGRFPSHASNVAFSPDGRRLAITSPRNVRVCDSVTGAESWSAGGHQQDVRGLAWSPDGRLIASGSFDNTVRIWNPSDGALIRVLDARGAIHCVAFSVDSRFVLAAGSEASILVWDVATGEEVGKVVGHGDVVYSLAISQGGKQVASGSLDKTVRIWSLQDRAELLCLRSDQALRGVAFSPDGRFVAVGSKDSTLRVWDVNAGTELARLEGHESEVMCVAWSPDGRRIASASSDRTVRIWRAPDKSQVRAQPRLPGHTGKIIRICFSPDGKHFATTSWDGSVRLWCGDTGVHLESSASGHSFAIAFSPDSRLVAVGLERGPIQIRDPQRWGLPLHLAGHTDRVVGQAFSPDGESLASASWDHTVRIWDVKRAEEILRLPGHRSERVRLSFSPDGRRLVCIAEEGLGPVIEAWDTRTGESLPVPSGTALEAQEVAACTPWRVATEGIDVVVGAGEKRPPVGWMPVSVEEGSHGAHPSGRSWVVQGANNRHLYFFTLESEPDDPLPAEVQP